MNQHIECAIVNTQRQLPDIQLCSLATRASNWYILPLWDDGVCEGFGMLTLQKKSWLVLTRKNRFI